MNQHQESFSLQNVEKYEKNYSNDNFWDKMKREACKAGGTVVYVALQLYYLMTSRDVPIKDKTLIIGALGYLILPTDLIPDLMPAIGYSDDLTALIAVFNLVKRNINDDIRFRAREKTKELLGTIDNNTFKFPTQ